MRVISGVYRGRKLESPKDASVRPTTDRIKESIFNILQEKTGGSIVLDLFAGSGALGIEALSRGAEKVYFCDNNRESLALLQRNLSFVPGNSYEIIKGDFHEAIQKLAARGVKCDIVLCDPPYMERLGSGILKELTRYDILARNAIVTVEHKKNDTPIVFPPVLGKQSERVYGETAVDFYISPKRCAVTGTFDPFTNGHRHLVTEALKLFDEAHIVFLINEQKTTDYSLEERMELAEISLREQKKRVKFAFYAGLAIDYCKEHGIHYIVRGVRDEEDFSYEHAMAEYNEKNGAIKTLLIPAKDKSISSTRVKALRQEGLVTGKYVEESIIERL